MGQITLQEILDLARTGGLAFVYFLIIYGGYKQWWVWGWLYRQVVADRDEWKRMALRVAKLTDTVADRVDRAREKERDEYT